MSFFKVKYSQKAGCNMKKMNKYLIVNLLAIFLLTSVSIHIPFLRNMLWD